MDTSALGNSFRSLNFHSKNTNWTNINEEFSKINWENVIKSDDLDQSYDDLCRIILDICKNNVPKKKAISKPRIPRDRRILMKMRLNLKKQLVRSRGRRKLQILEKLEVIQQKISESHQNEWDPKY